MTVSLPPRKLEKSPGQAEEAEESRTTGSEMTSYDYDSLGNLVAVALPDGRQIEYRVDAYGRRLAKLVNGTVVSKWLYAGGLLPVAELDVNDNLISVFNGSFLVRDGETYRIITDHVGSPRQVVNASTGEVVQQMTYDEWGNISEDTNPGFQPFGFAGGLYDPDTGLVRFGARDYDPLAGRWTTKDPIRFRGGTTNLYVYCGGNPVNFVDPVGLEPLSEAEASLGMPPGTWDIQVEAGGFVTDEHVRAARSALLNFLSNTATGKRVRESIIKDGGSIGITLGVGSGNSSGKAGDPNRRIRIDVSFTEKCRVKDITTGEIEMVTLLNSVQGKLLEAFGVSYAHEFGHATTDRTNETWIIENFENPYRSERNLPTRVR